MFTSQSVAIASRGGSHELRRAFCLVQNSVPVLDACDVVPHSRWHCHRCWESSSPYTWKCFGSQEQIQIIKLWNSELCWRFSANVRGNISYCKWLCVYIYIYVYLLLLSHAAVGGWGCWTRESEFDKFVWRKKVWAQQKRLCARRKKCNCNMNDVNELGIENTRNSKIQS